MSLNWPVLRFLLIPSPSVALNFTGRFRLSGLSLLLLTFCLPSGVLELLNNEADYTIHPSSLALSLATFQALARNSAEVMAMRRSFVCTMSLAANHRWPLGFK
jgi:hypothetical protein